MVQFLPQTMSGASSLAGVLLAEKKPPGKCHRKLNRSGLGRDGLIGLGKEHLDTPTTAKNNVCWD
jgi:hypothetical protein